MAFYKEPPMYEVFVWVPTKGWRSVLKCSGYGRALKMAKDLEPLEVKLVEPDGAMRYGGQACKIDHDLPAPKRTLENE